MHIINIFGHKNEILGFITSYLSERKCLYSQFCSLTLMRIGGRLSSQNAPHVQKFPYKTPQNGWMANFVTLKSDVPAWLSVVVGPDCVLQTPLKQP